VKGILYWIRCASFLKGSKQRVTCLNGYSTSKRRKLKEQKRRSRREKMKKQEIKEEYG
jgi:hypothetical protein